MYLRPFDKNSASIFVRKAESSSISCGISVSAVRKRITASNKAFILKLYCNFQDSFVGNAKVPCHVPAANLLGASSDKPHPLTVPIRKLTVSILRSTFVLKSESLQEKLKNAKEKLEKLAICF